MALRIAIVNFNGQPLTINGSDQFTKRCLEVAIGSNFPVTFTDKEMENAKINRTPVAPLRSQKNDEDRHNPGRGR